MSSLNCGFSGFITKFVETYSSSNILSELKILPSLNGSFGHVSDAFVYIGSFLIQFSFTRDITTNISAETTVTLTFPTFFSNINYSCIAIPFKQSNNNLPNIILIEQSSSRTNNSCRVRILNNGGNFYWIAIGLAAAPTGINFSKFITSYTISNPQSTNLLSKGEIVPSLNTSIGHTQDGYIYIGNLLIQFSATPGSLPGSINNGTSTNILFPITYSINPYVILICGVAQRNDVVDEYNILDATASGYNNSFTLPNRFRVITGYNAGSPPVLFDGNIRWIVIGPAS